MQDSFEDQEEYRRAVRYLLGELAGKSAEEFEQRYLADQDTFEFLEAVEEDLIEDYLRGGLSADQRLLFERRYMTRPENRQKIEFAKELLRCVAFEDIESSPEQTPAINAGERPSTVPGPGSAPDSGPQQPSAPGAPGTDAERPVPSAYPRPLAMAAAAAVIIVIGAAIWLAIDVVQLNNRLATANQKRAELEARADELRSRLESEQGNNKALADELQQVQQELRALQQRGPAASALSLFLPLDSQRGPSAARQARLTQSVASLDLQLDINSLDFELYRATVRQLSDGVIWTGTNLKLAPGASGKTLKIRLPAATLKPGAYVVTLEGITDSGEPKYAAEYSFTVVRE